MIIMLLLFIFLFLLFTLSEILDADLFETILTAMIIIGLVMCFMLICYLGLLVWRGLR